MVAVKTDNIDRLEPVLVRVINPELESLWWSTTGNDLLICAKNTDC